MHSAVLGAFRVAGSVSGTAPRCPVQRPDLYSECGKDCPQYESLVSVNFLK